MATEIKAPAPWKRGTFTIFLAGAIDMGSADDWQSQIVKALADYDVLFLNPRRDDWDSSWEQTATDPQFREQVVWEQTGLAEADFRTFVFLDDSKAPITLLELGENIDKPGAVLCEPEFYRKGNVDIASVLHNMPMFESVEGLIEHIKTLLDEKGLRVGATKTATPIYELPLEERLERMRDWVRRNGYEMDDRERVHAYHATPQKNVEALETTGLRRGAHLIKSIEQAAFFAGRDREIPASKIAVFEAWIPLDAFYGPVWVVTNRDLTPQEVSLRRVSTGAGSKDIAPAPIVTASASKKIADGMEPAPTAPDTPAAPSLPLRSELEKQFPPAGPIVSGLEVRAHVPNRSSIAATYTDYTVLPGVREVPMSVFQGLPTSPTRLDARSRRLMEAIDDSRELNPLIVVIDPEGAYILEGAHRIDALSCLGVPTIPAIVVIDEDDVLLPEEPTGEPKISARKQPLPLWDGDGRNGPFPGKEPGGRLSKITLIPASQLQPSEDQISPENVDEITEALRGEEREVPALIVEENHDGTYTVIDGHHRLEAAKRVGYTEIPCRIYTYADDVAAQSVTASASSPAQQTFLNELYAITYPNPFNPRERVWEDKIILEVYPFDGRIHISSIRSVQPGNGHASRALDILLRLADKAGVEVDADAVPFGGKQLNKKNLTAWYKRHGFVSDGGDGDLVYRPKGVTTPDKPERLKLDGGMKIIPMDRSAKRKGTQGLSQAKQASGVPSYEVEASSHPVVATDEQAQGPTLWHGGRISGPVEVQSPTKGRYEAGPGLYLTNSYSRAAKYAKGGGSTYLVTLRAGLRYADDVLIPLTDGIEFAKTFGAKGKKIAEDLRNNCSRQDRDAFTANVIVNLVVNYEAGSGRKGVELARFLVAHGVDAGLEYQSGGEQWVVVFNPDAVLRVKKVPAAEVTPEMRMLPKVGSAVAEPEAPAQPVTETPAFKAWFGNSKVVDANGEPLRVYHGTMAEENFDTFRGDLRSYFDGFFFTDSPGYAGGYTVPGAPHSRVIPAYLRIANPCPWEKFLKAMRSFKGGHGKGRAIPDLIAQGYDGVITDKSHEWFTEIPNAPGVYIVFSANQIKSAIGNNGEFNPENKSITAAVEAPAPSITETPAFKAWFRNSIVKDAQGNPLVVYRGEHGEKGSDEEFHSRRPSLSFGGPETASIYALEPNDREVDGHASLPRVYPCYLRIERPIVNDTEDPFIDFSLLADTFGDDTAAKWAYQFRRHIENTNNWEEVMEEYAGEPIISVPALLAAHPEALRKLYMLAYPLLDDEAVIATMKAKGFDGAIHGGSGASNDEAEYKVFDTGQVKSAIGNNGQFDPNSKSIISSASLPGTSVQPVTEDPRQRPGFNAWFAGSKIVDEQGEPLVVYHGSPHQWIPSFDHNMRGGGTTYTRVKFDAFWFTSSYENAEFYGNKEEKDQVDPKLTVVRGGEGRYFADVYANENPYRTRRFFVGPYPTKEKALSVANEEIEEYHRRINEPTHVTSYYLRMGNPLVVKGIPGPKAFKRAVEGGHDGILARNIMDGTQKSDIYVVFEPGQIKAVDSAAFDMNDHRVRASQSITAATQPPLPALTPGFKPWFVDTPAGQLDENFVPAERPVTDTPEFQKWFSGSRVVDADGQPLVVYHATSHEGKTFSNRNKGYGQFGHWFDAKPGLVEDYAGGDHPSDRPNVIPVFLSIKTPKVFPDTETFKAAVNGKYGPNIPARAQKLRSDLKKQGFDGALIHNSGNADSGRPDFWVAFDTKQIKSATGNGGGFDPGSKSIVAARTVAPGEWYTQDDTTAPYADAPNALWVRQRWLTVDPSGPNFMNLFTLTEPLHKLMAGAVVGHFSPRQVKVSQPLVRGEGVDYFLEHPEELDSVPEREPIVVAKTKSGLWLLDGNHRATAAALLGRKFAAKYLDLANTHLAAKSKKAMTIGPVYHGTTYDFDEFKKTKGLRSGFLGSIQETDVAAFFFTENKRQAIAYAKNRQKHTKQPARVITAYLTINHLLDLTNPNWTETKIAAPPLPLHRTEEHPEDRYENHAEELNGSKGLLDYLVNYLLADEMTSEDWDYLGIDDGRWPGANGGPAPNENFRAWDLFDDRRVGDALRYLGFDGAKVPEGTDAEFGGESICVFSASQVRILSNVAVDRGRYPKAASRACTCGHSAADHAQPPDFGCQHESEGCGCLGYAEAKSKKAAATQEQMIREARGHRDDCFVPGEPGWIEDPSTLHWVDEAAFATANITTLSTAECKWMVRALQDRLRDGHDSPESAKRYYDALKQAIRNQTVDHILVVQGADGRFYLWDGNHRYALARLMGIATIPAWVGYAPTAKPIEPDYGTPSIEAA